MICGTVVKYLSVVSLSFNATVDVNDNSIVSWDQGRAHSVFSLVNDTGTYSIYDSNNNLICSKSGISPPSGLVDNFYNTGYIASFRVGNKILNWPLPKDYSDLDCTCDN